MGGDVRGSIKFLGLKMDGGKWQFGGNVLIVLCVSVAGKSASICIDIQMLAVARTA